MSRGFCPSFAVPLLAAALLVVSAAPASARQEGSNGPLRVYLECGPCDFDFVRQNVTYVDWMRDRADADLHILARSETAGGGGRVHTLDFIGLRRHAGKSDTLTYSQGRDDTQDVTRRGLGRVLQIGMMRYLADTPAAERITIAVPQAPAGSPAATPATPALDPWNAWVFSVGGSGFINGESSQNFTNVSTNVSANRITADWKINLSSRGTYGRQSFTYGLPADRGDTTVISIRRDYSANGLMVRSVNGHASVGARLSAGTSTFGNTELFFNIQPAVEYNVFPYAESTRRQLLVSYGAGIRSQSYREETIYSRTEETRGVHALSSSFSTRQAWGNLNFGVGGEQYFHDTSLYNLNFFASTSLNVVRGLSLNFGGNYSMVRDQIALPKRNLTQEEVLLRQRQIATSYRYFMNMGLSYRFGSSLQNVVNPRFGSSGGGGIVMMF